MTEQFPKSESPEFSGEELALIQHLKEKGSDNEETKKLLDAWLDREEARANQINTPRANIELNVKLAKVCAEAGLHENAREYAENAMTQATNEGDPDLWDAAKSILDKIEESN